MENDILENNNIKIELFNHPDFICPVSWNTDVKLKSTLLKTWTELERKTDGLLDIVLSNDKGIFVLINSGKIIWHVYKSLVIMRTGTETEFKYDAQGLFLNEVIKSFPFKGSTNCNN